jgi:hypothetical protein
MVAMGMGEAVAGTEGVLAAMGAGEQVVQGARSVGRGATAGMVAHVGEMVAMVGRVEVTMDPGTVVSVAPHSVEMAMVVVVVMVDLGEELAETVVTELGTAQAGRAETRTVVTRMEAQADLEG